MLNKELKSNQNLLASARRDISQKTTKYEKLIKEFNASKSTRAQEIPTNSLESQAITPETELADIVVPKPSNKDLTDITNEAMDVEAAAVSALLASDAEVIELSALDISADEPESPEAMRERIMAEIRAIAYPSPVGEPPKAGSSIDTTEAEIVDINSEEASTSVEKAVSEDEANENEPEEMTESEPILACEPDVVDSSTQQISSEIASESRTDQSPTAQELSTTGLPEVNTEEVEEASTSVEKAVSEDEASIDNENVKPEEMTEYEPISACQPDVVDPSTEQVSSEIESESRMDQSPTAQELSTSGLPEVSADEVTGSSTASIEQDADIILEQTESTNIAVPFEPESVSTQIDEILQITEIPSGEAVVLEQAPLEQTAAADISAIEYEETIVNSEANTVLDQGSKTEAIKDPEVTTPEPVTTTLEEANELIELQIESVDMDINDELDDDDSVKMPWMLD